MATDTEIPRLVSMPREQYLRQQETKIRSDAGRLIHSDPAINNHLSAVLSAEDLYEFHSAVEEAFLERTDHRAARHGRFKEMAHQLKLHHLDQLSNLIH